MTKKTDESTTESYQDLIHEGIDELNASENFHATTLHQEEQLPTFSIPRHTKIAWTIMGVFIVINILLRLQATELQRNAIPRVRADAELQSTLAEQSIEADVILRATQNLTALDAQKAKKLSERHLFLPSNANFEQRLGALWFEKDSSETNER